MIPGDPNLVLWDIAESRVVRNYQGFDGLTAPGAVAISPNGQYVAAGGGYLNMPIYNLMVWQFVSGEVDFHCRLDVKDAIPAAALHLARITAGYFQVLKEIQTLVKSMLW